MCEAYPKEPTCLLKPRRIRGGRGAFLTIPPKPLNSTECAYGILVQRPRQIKQRAGKWAALPGHHLANGDLALENKACAVRCEVLLRKFGLDKLLNVSCKILRQDRMCAIGMGTEVQGARKGTMRSKVTYPVLSVLTVRADLGRDGGSTRMGVRAARALTGLSFSVASGHVNHPNCSV